MRKEKKEWSEERGRSDERERRKEGVMKEKGVKKEEEGRSDERERRSEERGRRRKE